MLEKLLAKMPFKKTIITAGLLLSLAGCGSSNQGEEGGHCYPNHTCNVGLACYSNLCVRVPTEDGGPFADGGNSEDGGVADGGVNDGGAPDGNYIPDDGGHDAGISNEDGGTLDSGLPFLDGGEEDGGAPDGNYILNDGGQQIEDGGQVNPNDGGSNFEDGGQIPTDGGNFYDGGAIADGGSVNPEDGGAIADGGSLDADGGPLSDGGSVNPEDGGAFPDGGYTPNDGGAADGGSNFEDGGAFPDGGQYLPDGGSAIADGGQILADGGAPEDGGQIPADGGAIEDGGSDAGICLDDILEPNDSVGTARHTNPGTYSDLKICPNNGDWYSISVSAGETLEVKIDFTNANGDLNLRLYDSTETLLASSEGTNDSETVSNVSDAYTIRFVKVYGAQSRVSNSYTMTITRTAPDAGLPTDAGIPEDGGMITDGGLVADGGVFPDGGAIADGGSVLDGGVVRDGGLTLDAGIVEDAGIVTPYTPDNNCITLFHFDNSINNDCMAVYNSIQSIGGQSQYQEGKLGSAIYLDGDRYLRGLGNITLDIVNALTVEAWIKPEKTENSYKGAFGNIFHTTSSGIDSNNPGYYGFVLWVTNGRVNFTAGIEGQMYHLSAEAQLPTDKFTHIAATYDNGVAQIYVNRHLAIEGNTNGNLSRIPNSYVQFTMGADANSWNAFIGAIDELRVSNVAREF